MNNKIINNVQYYVYMGIPVFLLSIYIYVCRSNFNARNHAVSVIRALKN